MCKHRKHALNMFMHITGMLYSSCYSAVRSAINGVNQAIVSGSLTQLLHSLQCEDTRLRAVYPDNVQWYMDVLSKAIKDKEEVYIYIHMYYMCAFSQFYVVLHVCNFRFSVLQFLYIGTVQVYTCIYRKVPSIRPHPVVHPPLIFRE